MLTKLAVVAFVIAALVAKFAGTPVALEPVGHVVFVPALLVGIVAIGSLFSGLCRRTTA